MGRVQCSRYHDNPFCATSDRPKPQFLLQEDRTDDADQCEDDDRDVNHEKYRVKLADLVEDWSSIRRPIP